MFEALREAEKKYEEIGEKLMQPDVVSNPETFKNLMKEHKTLTPIIEKYREYTRVEKDIAEAHEIIREESDKELRELAEEELRNSKEALEKISEELKILLLPRDENDDKNVIVEIRAGTGGEEAALFAHSLHRMYTMYAEAKGFKVELMNINETELGGCKEVSFMVEGDCHALFRAIHTFHFTYHRLCGTIQNRKVMTLSIYQMRPNSHSTLYPF
ncbi:MAG: PCRF domain-containing protein, partial [Clostridia bacterium]|nr:PCRF domain-containing protein [Clostridia bacterium]